MDGHINCKGGKVLKKEQTILEWLGINNKWERSVLILQLIRCFVALPGGFFVIFFIEFFTEIYLSGIMVFLLSFSIIMIIDFITIQLMKKNLLDIEHQKITTYYMVQFSRIFDSFGFLLFVIAIGLMIKDNCF